jgi:acyl-CoA synthetase (AMP-forming)/AMP-acid ligase II
VVADAKPPPGTVVLPPGIHHVVPAARPETTLLVELLDAAARLHPGRPAVSDAAGCDTYAEMLHRSRRAAHWLSINGIRHGDRVALRLHGGRDFTALLYGALRLGAIVVPVNPRIGPFQERWLLSDAEPRLVVAESVDVPRVEALTSVPIRTVTAASAHRSDADGYPRPGQQVLPSDIALLMYTSGSTAMPRAVMCPHERVRFVVAAIAARLSYTYRDIVFCRIPVSFDYGLYQMFLCAAAAASLVFRPDLPDAMALRAIRAARATVVPIVPTLASILMRLAERNRAPALSVRLLTNTGATLTAAHAAGLLRVFPHAAILRMYGMTECKRITIADLDDDARHPDSVGRALDGTEVLVVDDDGALVATGVVGEVWVRGPHVMDGYWRAAEATRGRFADLATGSPTLRTGDYGHLDEEGRLTFVGRRDDIFKRNGVRMSTQEIEAAVLDIPGVRAAAALPPEPGGDLVVWAAADLPGSEVLAGIAGRLEPVKVPDRCVVVPELPTTINGKIDTGELRRRILEGQAS